MARSASRTSRIRSPTAGRSSRPAPAGVCGTELHFLEGMIPPPHDRFVLGHESAGVVLEAPAGSAGREGDRVAVYNFVGCGRCTSCRTGRESLCTDPVGQLGFSLDGGFADVVRVPGGNLIPLPETVSFETAAVLACSGMSVVHASRLAGSGSGTPSSSTGSAASASWPFRSRPLRAPARSPSPTRPRRPRSRRSSAPAETIVLEGGRGLRRPARPGQAADRRRRSRPLRRAGRDRADLRGRNPLARARREARRSSATRANT